jgi:hypothetical protein
MKKIIIKGISAGFALLLFSYLGLAAVVNLFPALAEEYYNPVFSMEGEKSVLFFIHPFIVSFALAWFWRRFKSLFHGSFWWRGTEVGLVYGLIAVLPSMWMIYSAMAVSLPIVFSWFTYGVLQGIVVGIIYARISP